MRSVNANQDLYLGRRERDLLIIREELFSDIVFQKGIKMFNKNYYKTLEEFNQLEIMLKHAQERIDNSIHEIEREDAECEYCYLQNLIQENHNELFGKSFISN